MEMKSAEEISGYSYREFFRSLYRELGQAEDVPGCDAKLLEYMGEKGYTRYKFRLETLPEGKAFLHHFS